MMNRAWKTTADGSKTLYVDHFNQHYHSVHGALQESMHVFINAGLHAIQKGPVDILEMGFGTGLNAMLTASLAEFPIHYVSYEAYPLVKSEWTDLNYDEIVPHLTREQFELFHRANWNTPIELLPGFILEKRQAFLEELEEVDRFDLVYYDAFAPESQPELWTESLFRKVFTSMKSGGILVTYCAKGSVKRAMKAAGFDVYKMPGPPMKREMTKCIKP